MVEKNIFVEVEIRAIKDGAVWQRSVVEMPRQDKDSYTVIETELSEAMKKLGVIAKTPRDQGPPPNAQR